MTQKEKAFIAIVLAFYRRHKRRKLPWRHTTNPYHILVSEVMLQQTQVERVVPKYTEFLRAFPTVEVLATSPLSAVLRAWQGLGYNRRAQHLHECAKIVFQKYKGVFPKDYEILKALPGLGPYTAGAVMAFSYNKAVPLIETNIRSVFLHHFFEYDTEVSDTDIMPLIERTLDTKNPRTWYYALMDYGAFIKKMYGNPNERSKHHVRQSTFKGSDREIRGAIIRLLSVRPHSRRLIHTLLKRFSDIRIDAQLEKLHSEHLIQRKGVSFSLSD